MNRLDRIAIASRVFCIAAILGLSLISGDIVAVESTILLFAIALTASTVSVITRVPEAWVAVGEALLAGLVIGLVLPTALPVLPYLVVPALVAGISRGLMALFLVMAAEVLSIGLLWLLVSALVARHDIVDVVLPWLLTSFGVGLLGSWLRQLGKTPDEGGPDESYESARRLLTQLRTVARRLSAGLDPVSMASQLLSHVHDHLNDTRSAVFIRSDGGVLSPLGYRGERGREDFAVDDVAIDTCWAEMEPAHSVRRSVRADLRYRTALPLRVGSRMIGVVVADGPAPVNGTSFKEVMHEVDEHSLRLDTALAFDEVRSIATVEERHRLAREIHDGIAQEVASLGYVVDDLAATTTDTSHAERLRELRTQLTRMVGDLRLSIFDLRSDVTSGAGLGSALSDYVHQVGARSAMTVHLTLDESPTRLRAGVETELLRIAQEAITNARKHSNAANLWVDCRVRPPFARLQVRDDGSGLKQGREDSYGLRIMHERAERIDASLQIHHARA